MVGTTNRIGIAAIDATTGIATSWNANSDGVMRTVTVSGSTIYVGGYFTTIGGQSRSSIAALNATTGNATDWSANTDLSGVLSIVLRGQDLLIGGEFWSIKNTPHSYFSVIPDSSMTLSGVYGIKYRTFTASEFGANINQKPMKRPYFPNTANVIQETYKKFPLAPIIVGKAFVYNNEGKLLAYIQPKAYTDVLKTFNKSGVTHTGTARGLDFDKKSAPLLKRWVTLDVTKHDNTLVANLLALKVNIVASDTGVTPNGLADLLYNEGSGNPLSGKSISEIADYAGDLMTNWRYLPLATFANLDTTIAKINAAFSGVFDTTQWIVGSKLVVKGTRELGKISFLQPNTSSFRHRVIPVSPEDVLPSSYSLEQNYPNPFNPTTTIQFELGQNSLVTLKIYNILGQEVATLLDRDELYEGQREVMFNGKELASGIYFYRLVAESIDDEGESSTEPFVQVKKMVLLK
ncbi:MAG: T9SS type A sorting domain-containing protein [Ignavibacteriae bacterium]|nr:T9SS type A sorting domain-containing protein [Ignavibacteriota bacterium]